MRVASAQASMSPLARSLLAMVANPSGVRVGSIFGDRLGEQKFVRRCPLSRSPDLSPQLAGQIEHMLTRLGRNEDFDPDQVFARASLTTNLLTCSGVIPGTCGVSR